MFSLPFNNTAEDLKLFLLCGPLPACDVLVSVAFLEYRRSLGRVNQGMQNVLLMNVYLRQDHKLKQRPKLASCLMDTMLKMIQLLKTYQVGRSMFRYLLLRQCVNGICWLRWQVAKESN